MTALFGGALVLHTRVEVKERVGNYFRRITPSAPRSGTNTGPTQSVGPRGFIRGGVMPKSGS